MKFLLGNAKWGTPRLLSQSSQARRFVLGSEYTSTFCIDCDCRNGGDCAEFPAAWGTPSTRSSCMKRRSYVPNAATDYLAKNKSGACATESGVDVFHEHKVLREESGNGLGRLVGAGRGLAQFNNPANLFIHQEAINRPSIDWQE